jgi:hypothetical protein
MTARRQLAMCIAGCYPDYLRTRRDGWCPLTHYFCFGMSGQDVRGIRLEHRADALQRVLIMNWFGIKGQQHAATTPIPDLYEIALTTMRNRLGMIEAISPLYAARAPSLAREIAQVSPPPISERAVVDYLENAVLRTEFSLMEDTLDGSQDLGIYA